MISRIKWIDRKFPNEFPLEVYPCILARLRGTAARLAEITETVPGEVLTRKNGEAWSIQEHVGHLITAEMLWEYRLNDYEAGKKELFAADLSGRKTVEANFNEHDIKDLLTRFRTTRDTTVSRFANLDDAIVATAAHHPRLNMPMRPIDMAYFIAEHDDHHIAILYELLETKAD